MSTLKPSIPGEDVEVSHPVNVCVLLGRTLFNFGATAQRIQESVACLARHLGCKLDMLISYDSLLMAVDDGAQVKTRIDSSQRAASLNLTGLSRVGDWLRQLPHSRSSPAELEQELAELRHAPHRHHWSTLTLAAGCAGLAFCIANGGDPISWFCSFVASSFIFLIRRPLASRKMNIHLTIFAIALAGSFLAALLGRMTHTSTPAIALLAPLLFLVPGTPLITGGIDIIRSHVTVGVARIGFALALLTALILGVGLTLPMVPAQISPPFSLPGAWQLIMVSVAGALAAGALACLNNADGRLIGLCAMGGLTARVVREILGLSGIDVITGSLLGVVCSTVLIGFVSRQFRWPAMVAAGIAALPMVPGYFAIDGLHSLLSFSAARTPDLAQLSGGLHSFSRAVFISVALIVGVIGPTILRQDDKEPVPLTKGKSQ
jgi:uncharacterized membrane protein YjjP (DUF1212 family)